MKHSINMPCPSCQQSMELHALHCQPCGLTVTGPFQTNEFAQLAPDDLQFLRVFLNAEGRIKEMEGPLGLSYPTIRNRLAQLKEKIFAQSESPTRGDRDPSTAEALEQLERGELKFEDALKIVQKKKKR